MNDASGVYGTADYTTLDSNPNTDPDSATTSQYLAVSVGHVPYACRAPYNTLRCLPEHFVETFATECKIYMTAKNGISSFFTITNGGAGYTSAPTISFSGGGGSGASATATISGGGNVTAITLVSGGSGYTSAPTISFSDGGGANAAATCSIGGNVDGSTICANWLAPSRYPEIRCVAPAGVGEGQDLIIYWHGVATVLSNWFHYDKPIVESLDPSSTGLQGGTITIRGRHFGPKASYLEKTQTTTDKYAAQVVIVSRRPTTCRKITWVSDRELRCVVPPMVATRAVVDTTSRTSKVFVVVDVFGSRSQENSLSTLTYTQVPGNAD